MKLILIVSLLSLAMVISISYLLISLFYVWKWNKLKPIVGELLSVNDMSSSTTRMSADKFDLYSDSNEVIEAKYSYRFSGKEYLGNTVFLGGWLSGYQREKHQELLEQWEGTKKIEICINPNDPDQSFLYLGLSKSHIFGAVLFLVTCALVLFLVTRL